MAKAEIKYSANQDKKIRSIKEISERQKMNEIIREVAESYGLGDFATVEKRKDFLSENEITDEFLELVKAELPKQPWPAGVHKTIAAKLGCTNSKVYTG